MKWNIFSEFIAAIFVPVDFFFLEKALLFALRLIFYCGKMKEKSLSCAINSYEIAENPNSAKECYFSIIFSPK